MSIPTHRVARASCAAAVVALVFAAAAPAGADDPPRRGSLRPAFTAPLGPPSAEQAGALAEERAQDLELVVRRTADFREIVDSTVRSVYGMRKAAIDGRYRSRIEREEQLELEALRESIEYFEKFLAKYPDEPQHTPDAMFRLAELYYDVSYIEYLNELGKYNEAQERGTAGDEEPPVKEFTRTIEMFRALIRRYPDAKNIDGAYYLLGYCLNDTGEEAEARMAWLNLVCANRFTYDPVAFENAKADGGPKRATRVSASLDTGVAAEEEAARFVDPFEGCEPLEANSRFYHEAWLRVGDYHFDYDTSRFGVETAIAAYRKLTEDPANRFYANGLYKLAWSYYKASRYPESIRAFSQVVDYSDAHAGRGSEMRPESIQYLAVCFFTEDWDGDQLADEETPIQRLQSPHLMPQDRRWTREVYALLGDTLVENEKQEDAIAVWRLFLQKWPLDVQAPFVQSRIADAYRGMRRFDEELEERSKLGRYGKGSEWWAANEDRPESQNQVSQMSQDALIGAAVAHHQNAQALRAKGQATGDPQVLEFALEEYNLAAASYRKFIEQNPDTPDAYDLNFQMADALFWSGQYAAAKAEYVRVRDSNLDDRHREQAAHSVILCIERTMEDEKAAGRLDVRDAPPALAGEPPAPQRYEMPALLLELMAERDNYLRYNPGAPQTSTFEYQSAQNYYRYGDWDEARRRYGELYAKHCKKDELSLEAWKVLLNMATDLGDLNEKERLALLEQEQQCGVPGARISEDDSIDLGSLLGDVAMQRSMDRFNECKEGKDGAVCTEAGDQLVAAVAKAPKHKSADAALHNAALAYEFAQRFDTAMQLYGRIVNEYPDSQWVDKCLYKQAYAANAFFEYEKALGNYRILADAPKFKASDYREDAIYNAAYILTNLQSYTQAIPYWERFSREVDAEDKRVEAAFNAADMLFRAGMWNEASRAYETFILRNGRNTGAGALVVKAAYRMSEADGKRGRRADQVRAWRQTLELYGRLVNQPGSMSAEYAAHAHFLLIEEDMREFEKFTIRGSRKQIEQRRQEGAEKVRSFEARYREISRYRRPEWSLAAEFRIGYAYEVYAKAILGTPMPTLDEMLQMAGMSKAEIRYIKTMPEEERADMQFQIEDKIREKLEETVSAMEAKAQAEYRIAVDLSRKGNISNEWTLLALERMNAYDPDNYPRQHNGAVETGLDMVAAPPWAGEVP